MVLHVLLQISLIVLTLIFTSWGNLVMKSRAHSLLHPNCHLLKFNLNIHRLHTRQGIWHYEKANIDHIRTAINKFSWEKSFANNYINEKVNTLQKRQNDSDRLWINKNIKQLILDKNQAYKSCFWNNKLL